VLREIHEIVKLENENPAIEVNTLENCHPWRRASGKGVNLTHEIKL